MEQSLYQISGELLNIFDTIEENGGEVSDELLSQLEITKDNLVEKLDSYVKLIKHYESNQVACKTEKKRVDELKKSYESKIENLKTRVLDAVKMFGNTDKKGITRIELPTFKLSTRSSSAIEVNEERCNLLARAFNMSLTDLAKNSQIVCGDDCDLVGILGVINAHALSIFEENDYPENFVPFTLADLICINFDITMNTSIATLLGNDYNEDICNAIGLSHMFTFTQNINKTEIKQEIETYRNLSNGPITCAEIANNVSLQIG